MSNKVLFITDKYEKLNLKKDTSILMIEEAIKKKLSVFQCEINDLSIKSDDIYASCRNIVSIEANHTNEIYEDDVQQIKFEECFFS